MWPTFPCGRSANGGFSNSEFFSEGVRVAWVVLVGAFYKNLSDFQNLFLRKLSVSGVFTFFIRGSSFGNHVSNVFLVRSKEKVGWINTSGNVALMANANPMVTAPSRDEAIMNFPTNPMSRYIFAINSNAPVSKAIFGSYPKPTRGGFYHPCPKPVVNLHEEYLLANGVK